MIPQQPVGQMGQGGSPPASGAMGGAQAPSLASAPAQGSALGGSPAGLGGSSDPQSILQKAMLLLKSGAITQEQYQMILAKISGAPAGGAARPGAPPAGGAAQPLSTTGVPGAGPPMPPPSQQWNQ